MSEEQQVKVGQKWRMASGATAEVVAIVGVRARVKSEAGATWVVDIGGILRNGTLVTELESLEAQRREIVGGEPKIKVGDYWKHRESGVEHQVVGVDGWVHTETASGFRARCERHEFRNRFTINPGGTTAPTTGRRLGDTGNTPVVDAHNGPERRVTGMRPEHAMPYGSGRSDPVFDANERAVNDQLQAARNHPDAGALAIEMLTDLGYTFDDQSWVFRGSTEAADKAHAGQATLRRLGYTWKGGSEWTPPLGQPKPKCLTFDEATIDQKFATLMGSMPSDLKEPAAALRTLGLTEGTISNILDCLHPTWDGKRWTSKRSSQQPRMTPGYELLADVLDRAYHQAASGKGAERHAEKSEPFDEQVMQDMARRFGVGSLLGQAFKKSHESQRLPLEAGVRELLGAINYLAGAVIRREADETGG